MMWSTKILLVLLSIDVFTNTVADESSDNEARRFLDRVDSSISSKNPDVIAELFQSGFIFYGCNGTYNKQKSVEILINFPSESNFSSTVKSSEPVGRELINYTVEISRTENSFLAEFLLNRTSHQLVSGRILECGKHRPARQILIALMFDHQFFIDRFVNQFFERAKKVIRSYDKEEIENLFDDKFVFKGCQVVYDKTTFVQTIRRYVGSKQFDYEIAFAMLLEDYDMGIVANIFGLLEEDFAAKINYDSYNHKLTSVEVLNCPGTPIVKDAYWELFDKKN